ncbi:MAG: hypothetical protein DHS20C18_30810 [Saprospiraceae bacterium]|nr:MAG: hypothetical protein DHS20C18_30810 [Saprospiraceae bacterium]
MSPYQYGANNPIKYIDVNGDSLQVSFANDQARNAFIQVANRGLEGQFEVNISGEGIVTFQATEGGGDVSKLSKHGQAFYEENNKILNAGGITNLNVDYGRSDVHTGNLGAMTIDMADILQFNENPSQLGGTQIGKLTHEIVEQGHAQGGRGSIIGDPYRAWQEHHPTAIIAENNVNDSRRIDSRTLYGVQDFARGGRTVRTLINTKKPGTWRTLWMSTNRNIISVTNRALN